MEFGDFIDSPSGHPEVDENPEYMMPATSVTKDALLMAAFDKVSLPAKNELWKARKFSHDDSASTVTVLRYSDGKCRQDPQRIVQILISPKEHSENAETPRTSYSVSSSPDGLQIKQSVGVRSVFGRLGKTVTENGGIIASGSIDLNALKARKAAESIENELGLNFVSEAQTKQVIKIVVDARPEQ